MGLKSNECEAHVQPPGTSSVFKKKFCKKPVRYVALNDMERKHLCEEHGRALFDRYGSGGGGLYTVFKV